MIIKLSKFFLMIQSEILSRPCHPPLSFIQFDIHCSSNGFGGFRFSMAAGSQSVESWAKKLDLVQLGKKSIFPWISHAVQLARVSPLLETPSLTSSHPSPGRRFQRNAIGSVYESKGGLGGRRLGQRPFEPSGSFLFWNVPLYMPLPGRPPPSAPKMAGIIPLVYLTNINVRSSGQMSSFPTTFSPLSLLYTLHIDHGKRLFRPSKPYSENTSIFLF